MTSLATGLPSDQRANVRKLLRERMGDWLRLSFRHELLTARFVEGLRLEAARTFDSQVVRPLLLAISSSLPRIDASRLTSGNLVADLLPEVVSLRAEIERLVVRGVDVMRRSVETSMATMAREEVRWVEQAVSKVTGARDVFGAGVETAATEQVRRRVWLGDPTEKWFEKALQRPTADVARSWVTTGVKQGLTTEEITRGLVGTRTQTGLLEKPRHTAKALVRTAATHAANTARMDAFKGLGVTHWRFVATLDQRTSLQCASEDGNVYPVGEGPIPPLHPNCRSVASPVVGPVGREPSGQRASIDGPVPAKTTFEDWLGSLTKGEQDRYLGATKAAAWRGGKLSLRDMVGRDLEPLTLDELRALERL